MKYMLLLTRGAWQEGGSEEEKGATFGVIGEWFAMLSSGPRP